MSITHRNGHIRIELKGGGNPKNGAATAGDCEVVAEGQIHGTILRAKLVPFDGEVSSLDAQDIKEMDANVTVNFEGDFASVQGRFSHCGLRSDLTGKYRSVR